MGKLECKEITKIYQDHRKAVDTVSFTVETKGIFGLIGRNGAGKTTLIRILSTELEPTSGTATINDFDILENTDMIRERIAIVPQDARAISWMTPKQVNVSCLRNVRSFSFLLKTFIVSSAYKSLFPKSTYVIEVSVLLHRQSSSLQ
jgi:ABC-type multidrug transport system ATPase subunit